MLLRVPILVIYDINKIIQVASTFNDVTTITDDSSERFLSHVDPLYVCLSTFHLHLLLLPQRHCSIYHQA